VFGFPLAYEDGVWPSGVLRARNAAGWVQIEDVKQTGCFVRPGFSGAPVWDEELGGVVGMIVAADIEPGVRAAFLVPTDVVARLCPELECILQAPAAPLGKLCPVPSLPPHFLPRPEDLDSVKEVLLADAEEPLVITGATRKVGVHGMVGIGKSVLAAALAQGASP
jgi:hypothetical protein